MSTSRKPGVRNVPPPEGAKAASPYARFIPREELGPFATWSPGTLAGDGQSPSQPGVRKAAPAEPEKPAAPDLGQQLHAARQGGYQDGYRDGLAALEQFKQSYAAQMTHIGRERVDFVDAPGGLETVIPSAEIEQLELIDIDLRVLRILDVHPSNPVTIGLESLD